MGDARSPVIVHGEWADILDADEEIVWQGKPYQGLLFSGPELAPAWFGWFFFLFSVFWIVGAWNQSKGGGLAGTLFTLFGVPFVVIGFYVAIGQYPYNMFERRRTWYALTDRRAIIAKTIFGKQSLVSYPITKSTVLEYDTSANGSIWFNTKISKDSEDDITSTKIGFIGIDDARHVMSLMRKIQTRTP